MITGPISDSRRSPAPFHRGPLTACRLPLTAYRAQRARSRRRAGPHSCEPRRMMADRSWKPVTLGADYPAPLGAYSPAVRAGDFVYVSGQVPRDQRTGELLGGTIEEQAQGTLANLRRVLEAAGASLDDVVSVTVYLADEGDWGAFNTVYRETMRAPFPARAVVGASLRGVLIEISAVAYAIRPRP
jgi:2-iminobutanoate/2-iminopropanoate deaminase